MWSAERLCDFTLNEALPVMHIVAAALDQKPVESKQSVSQITSTSIPAVTLFCKSSS